MRRMTIALLLFFATMLLLSMSNPTRGFAEVNVSIGINVPLPAIVIPAPPSVVLIPQTYVYYVPDVDLDIFFYHNYWYRPYHGHWYRSRSYNGQWGYIVPEKVPHVVLHLPPDYRHKSIRNEHIPYGHLKKNWKRWEKERHWDKHEHKHEHEHSIDRGKRIHKY